MNARLLLTEELSRWHDGGTPIQIWLRDDDGHMPCNQFTTLMRICAEFSLAPTLCLVPGRMTPGFPDLVRRQSGSWFVAQHGFVHANHEPTGRPSEFGANRASAAAAADIQEGRRILERTFDDRFLKVFVPPWNSISPAITQLLPALGFVGLSASATKDADRNVDGLCMADAHVDLMNWSTHRGKEPDDVFHRLRLVFEQKRTGTLGLSEPVGLLTHHIAMDRTAWNTLACVAEILAVAHARWLATNEVFHAQA
jgi:hypothetical protein